MPCSMIYYCLKLVAAVVYAKVQELNPKPGLADFYGFYGGYRRVASSNARY